MTKMADWLSCEDLTKLTGWSARTVQRKAENKEIGWRNTAVRLKNGKNIREYSIQSLPAEFQIKAAKMDVQLSLSNAHLRGGHTGPGTQLALFSPRSAAVAVMQRVALPNPEDHLQATERLSMLAPLLGLTGKQSFPAIMPDGTDVSNWGQAIGWVATKEKKSAKTVRRFLSRYRQGGLPALADKQRTDKDSSRFFNKYHDAAICAAYLRLVCHQSVRAVYRAILDYRDLLGVPADEAPAYETVRAWFELAPPYLIAYSLEGRKAYSERMLPFLRRAYDDVLSNQCWVSDHMIHDVEVMNDCFPGAPYGSPIRLRFTCVLDLHSRYVVGMSWCWEGSSRSIATAVRYAVSHYGACDHWYCDNGKDYKRVAKGAMPAYLDESPLAAENWFNDELRQIDEIGILGRLKMKVTHCIVRHPQSKHVERFFRTLHEQFDKLWYQHYTGGAPHLRPDATAAEMEIHRKLMKHDRVADSKHPRASFFIAYCKSWIHEYNHNEHTGEAMEGRSPAEVFAQDRAPDDQRKQIPKPFELALLLSERVMRKVRECAVELTITPGHPRRYTYVDAVSRDILHERTDTWVQVAYDPNDQDRVAILDDAGHFLCSAAAEQLLRFAPEDAETQRKISEGMADSRHLEKETRSILTNISRAAKGIGIPTPVEMFANRAALPIAVNDVLTHRPLMDQAPALSPAPSTPAQAARLLMKGLKK